MSDRARMQLLTGCTMGPEVTIETLAPLSVTARSFHASVLIPAASAAASFCLIASKAIPKRDCSTFRVSRIVPSI